MGRERDGFWEYAGNLNGRFLCKFCERTLPGDVQLAARQAISAPKKKAGNLRSLGNDGETQVISTSGPNKKAKSLRQPTILGECKKDKGVVDKMLAKFIISNHITPDFAKMPYLVDFLRSVAEFGPSYKIPNTSALKSQLIPDTYKEVEEHVGNVKKLFTTTGCTLVMYDVM
ncbi:hypothetical protein Ddye_018128 [Dipteronia dyeriana]|uniref:Uncharacterized protein n=1 Tax=Dipteronia dyeriana TaxID=168575 RepID=A0AAD9X0G7_9ROSI|nr:hypothetical protein Ddye_018128 [Dipteronia dyeriana]